MGKKKTEQLCFKSILNSYNPQKYFLKCITKILKINSENYIDQEIWIYAELSSW